MEDTLARILAHERLAEAEGIGYQAARLRAARLDVPGETDVASERGPSGEGDGPGAGDGRAGGSSLAAGFFAALPLGLASVPFAFAYAVAADEAGLSPLQTILFSLVVYSGTGQLVAMGLIGAGAGALLAAGAVLAVSLRHLLLGAALAPLLGRLRLARRLPLAFGLSDEAFALSVGPLRAGGSPAHLAGAELGLFLTWQPAVAAAALVGGAVVPPRWLALDLVLPLSMLALLVLVVRGAHEGAIAAVAAAAAVSAVLLGAGPWATLAGIGAGALAAMLVPEVRRPARRRPSPEATR
jgi:predicted branched-subunit amino acid permease